MTSWAPVSVHAMHSPALSELSPLLQHHPLGASTGYMVDRRGDWPILIEEAVSVSSFAVELAALSEDELPSLLDYLASGPALPFRYVSVHGPSKDRRMPESELVAMLAGVPPFVDAVVLHPDHIDHAPAYAPLGSRLVIENMDMRKETGRTVDELGPVFDALPEAGFCFDVAHAWSIDSTMQVGHHLLNRFAPRLRHLHVSSVTGDCRHEPLTVEHEALFAPLLARCRDVPWILEAPIRET